MRAAAAVSGARWLAKLRAQPIRGIQLDPSGHVGVAAGQEAYAKSQIAVRLATPHLPFSDKAFTLLTAVDAFSDVYAPDRIPVAEAYLTQLDALGDSAATWQFEARRGLLWTFYLMGRSADVARHGMRAIELLTAMPFTDRRLLFEHVEERVYSPTVEALTGQPSARQAIEQLNAMVRAAARPTPTLLAVDADYAYLGSAYQRSAEEMIGGNAKLGSAAAPLIAHRWLNRTSGDSATMSLNDGKIRLVEVAHTGCVPCVYELHALQRMHTRFPQIEPVLLTWTFGYWGNRLIEPAEEVRHLTDYFVTNTKITYPVGIWSGKKVPNEDGGNTPEESPNLKDYPIFGKPMLWVIDGRGIIRRVFTGYDREIETQIVRTVEFLLAEAATTPRVSLNPPVVRESAHAD
jgi:hypothetical protein